MIRDLRSCPEGSVITADVCVVGAGPAGTTLARELAQAGTRVVVLESGGHRPDRKPDALDVGESVGVPFHGLTEGRARALGGTTHRWAGQCLRLSPSDFAERPWVPHSGWPLTAEDLDPHYARAERLLGIGPVDPERAWRRFGIEPPPIAPSLLEHRFTVFTPFRRPRRRHRRELVRSPLVDVLLHAVATRVRVDEAGVAGVAVRTRDGGHADVVTRTVVLCAGGIENARLLLVSEVGNRHDVVGRYFQEHPKVFSGDIAADRLDAIRTVYGMMRDGRVRYVPKLMLSAERQRSEGVLGAAAGVTFDQDAGTASARALVEAVRRRDPARDLRGDLRGVTRDAARVAGALVHRCTPGPMTAPWPRAARINVILEQAPNPASRIRLSRDTDDLGVPRAVVDWRLSDLERRTAETMLRLVDAEWGRLGIGRLTPPEWASRDDWTDSLAEVSHHSGTTRMSLDPRRGVVDPTLQVHDVPGLYACGSSVFPTSGHANPTLTIIALALRLADHLALTRV